MGDLPKGRTCLGVMTPQDSTNPPPPRVGTRSGTPRFTNLLTTSPAAFTPVGTVGDGGRADNLPRRGRVIQSRDIDQVTTDFNMCVQVELTVPSRLKPGTTVKVYMQVLHVKAHTMAREGKSVERGETIGQVGFFGMARIGNPHAHVEFFWSKAAALAYAHALAVDPYFIRRHYLDEDSPLVRVPERFRWWNDRLSRPKSDHIIKPQGNEAERMGVLATEERPSVRRGRGGGRGGGARLRYGRTRRGCLRRGGASAGLLRQRRARYRAHDCRAGGHDARRGDVSGGRIDAAHNFLSTRASMAHRTRKNKGPPGSNGTNGGPGSPRKLPNITHLGFAAYVTRLYHWHLWEPCPPGKVEGAGV